MEEEPISLTEEPYARYVRAFQSLRQSRADWPAFGFVPRNDSERGDHDANEVERDRVVRILQVEAQAEDLPLIRFLMEQEIRARETDSFQGAGEALTILAALLLEFGDSSDLNLFWRAKWANFDTGAGGFDAEFIFALMPAQKTLTHLREAGLTDVDEYLQGYDVAEIEGSIPGWRAALQRRVPRSMAEFSVAHFTAWADVFGDQVRYLRYRLRDAEGPTARAWAYRSVRRFAEAVAHWREAADGEEDAWERVSALTSLMEDAAKSKKLEEGLWAAREVDSLRHEIDSWKEVGLGRMSTVACYRLAMEAEAPEHGKPLYALANAWLSELRSFHADGLEAAAFAAEKWGSAEETRRFRDALAAEKERIEREIGGL